jgi:hypothetical protein
MVARRCLALFRHTIGMGFEAVAERFGLCFVLPDHLGPEQVVKPVLAAFP